MKKIQTNNMNGFNHVISNRRFNERATITFGLYSKDLPEIWALQEVPTGGKNLSCIKHLRNLALQNGYAMIMPEKTWEVSEHPKSIQSILLLRNAKNIEVLKLDDSIELYNRYNYVRADFEGAEYFIMNIHAPQTELFPGHAVDDGYVRLRKHLTKQFYVVLKSEIEKLVSNGKRLILLGDFNKNLYQQEVQELIDLGLCNVTGDKGDTYFCVGNNTEDSVDHIFVSQNILDEAGPIKCNVDTNYVKVQKLSDHATVCVGLSLLDERRW